MNYATPADIERMLPWKFTNTSSPTLAMVEDTIARFSAVVNTSLKAKGVNPPQENTDAWNMCQLIVVYHTCAEILRYRGIETGEGSLVQLAQYYDQLAFELRKHLDANPQAFSS